VVVVVVGRRRGWVGGWMDGAIVASVVATAAAVVAFVLVVAAFVLAVAAAAVDDGELPWCLLKLLAWWESGGNIPWNCQHAPVL